MEALIFDCDGVLVDTERDGHRIAFNLAFADRGIDVEWSIEEYKKLLSVAGGKERMKFFFEENGWPAKFEDREELIISLHKRKTHFYIWLVQARSKYCNRPSTVTRYLKCQFGRFYSTLR